MTPFDINPEHDADHSIDQDDLIAFHLRELPRAQEHAIHRAMKNNPHLQAESIAIASTLRAFPKQEPTPATLGDSAASTRIWQSLRPTLTPYIPTAAAPFTLFKLPFALPFPGWAIPTVAAAVLAATALVLALHHYQPSNPINLATNQPPSSTNISPTPPNPASDNTTSTPLRAKFTPSIRHTPFLTHLSPNPASATLSPSSMPTTASSSNSNPTPLPSSPSATPAAKTALATTRQPQPLATQQPLTPTFTPIIETRGHARTFDAHTTDITLAVIGNLTPDRSFTSLAGSGSPAVTGSFTQETTPSVGALASFHQQLRPWIGYRLTAAYSEPTFQDIYSASGNGTAGNIIDEHVYEASATYVVRGPHHHRLSTSAEAGAGILAFRHINQTLSADPVSNVVRPTGIFGVAAEFALSRHWAIHTGYRAALYRAPTAYPTYGSVVPPAPNNFTLSSEPVIGLTYRFHEASE
jgi:hypothetical protein